MKRLNIVLLLFVMSVTMLAQSTSVVTDSVIEKLKSLALLASYHEVQLPQEKVYLQMDNNAYIEGETLWFKLNVVRASVLLPTKLSRVAYVELLNAAGEVMQRKVLKIDKGEAWGSIALEPPILSGFYELRAYTREMLNWGRDVCFSRVFPVFRQPKNADTYLDLSINAIKKESNLPLGHIRPFSFKSEGGIHISFFPESGHRIENRTSRIAYKLTDDRGASLNGIVSLKDDKGEIVDETATIHDGMGLLTVQPTYGRASVEVSVDGESKSFALPKAEQQGYNMIVDNLSDSSNVSIIVQKAENTRTQLMGLFISCRGSICKFDTLKVNNMLVEMDIPKSVFRNGINQITLFDSLGNVVCERMVFKRPMSDQHLNLSIRQNSSFYAPLQPIALEMQLTDNEKHPVESQFALSVRDDEGELIESNLESMKSNLLLSSDLKGYVSRPDFYFESSDARHNSSLDLLLMVQGWSRYAFREMAEVEPIKVTQPIEEAITLDGYILRRWRDKPLAEADLGLLLYNEDGKSMKSQALTDELGYFAFKSDSVYDDWQGQFAVFKDEDLKQSRITLNRGFSPMPRSFYSQELLLKTPKSLPASAETRIETFHWNDTIPQQKIIHLGEATVKAKNKNKYIFYDKEEDALKNASIYYNMDMEIEKIQDAGEEVPLFYSWLSDKNKNFEYTNSVPDAGTDSAMANMDAREATFTCTYGGRPVTFFINNDSRDMRIGHEIYCDEIKSAVIMQESRDLMRFIRGEQIQDITNKSSDMVAIFLFTRPNGKLFKTKRGLRTFTIHGYNSPEAFYSPNYRQVDAPNLSDYRRTLYWNPCVKTDVSGKASALFFSNARGLLKLRISAQGLSSDGKYINYQR